MDDKNENIPDKLEPSDRNLREIPFDATTNFSLLGWLLDKLSKRKSFKEKIDFTIEE
jgi:hypothetical protein